MWGISQPVDEALQLLVLQLQPAQDGGADLTLRRHNVDLASQVRQVLKDGLRKKKCAVIMQGKTQSYVEMKAGWRVIPLPGGDAG